MIHLGTTFKWNIQLSNLVENMDAEHYLTSDTNSNSSCPIIQVQYNCCEYTELAANVQQIAINIH